jgi:hypothetical protein
MLTNVLDIDWAAHQISLKSRAGAILFDFSAAFPSLSHDMLWDALEILGIDGEFIEVVKLFYKGNKHFIKVHGMIFEGVSVHSGVRQGCPLSGLLFAICVDTLLRRISSDLGPLEKLGAFADDIGLVVLDFWKSSPTLQRVFDEFSQISGLHLNLNKTVMIPLWKIGSENNIRLLIQENCSPWKNITISDRGKYLGFIVGPRAELDGWSKPLQKFKARVEHWAALKLGIGMNIIVFNTYIVTVLEYVAQLLEVTEEVKFAMSWALRKLAPGPGNWISQRDLENLKSFGFKS